MTEAARGEPSHSWMARLVAGLVAGVCRRPTLVLTASLVLAAASGVLFACRIEYRTQRSDLMSPDKDYQQRWSAYLKEFGDEDDMVVVVEGTARERMTAALERVAAAVRAEPGRFDRLFYQVDLRPLRNRALMFLPAEQIRPIEENLQRMGPLLWGPTGPLAWRQVTLMNLLRQARERCGRFDPGAPLAPADEQFFTQLDATVKSAAQTLGDPAAYRNPWSSLIASPPSQSDMLDTPQYFFGGDGTLAFLLVRPVKAAESFTPALASVHRLREVLEPIRAEFPDLKLGLTGLPVLETDEMEASQRDTNTAGWVALVGVGLLYVGVYRNLRHPLLMMAQLLIGTAWATGWLTLTVGHLNILSSTFAVMLIGMGDYGVLWVTHYQDERTRGLPSSAAAAATALAIGPSVATAAFGTALAFFAAMLADFQAVAELGWIAGCGVLLCALATFTVLPALLCLLDRKAGGLAVVAADGERLPAAAPKPGRVKAWLPGLARRPRQVLLGGAAVLAILAACATRIGYDHNMLNMQASGLDSVAWERKLIAATAGASWHALSYADTPEAALALKAKYEALPEVSRVVEVASLVPADQGRKLELLGRVQGWLKSLPARGALPAPAAPRAGDLRKEVAFLVGALQPQAPLAPQPILATLLRDLATLRDHAAWAADEQAATRLHGFDRALAADLLDDLHRLRAVSEPRPITPADLPPPLRERYVGQSGKWLVQAYAKDGLWDIAPLERFVTAVRAVDAEATGKPFGTLEGLRAMQQGFAWAGVYALVVIVGVLWFDFRSVKYTLFALVPLGLGVVASLGVMGVCGVWLNPANMIALPLIVGVGIDNGVHVLHDYRGRPRGGPYTLGRSTGMGIAVSALTTILGFGTLMISGHRGLASLGFVLALGVAACMSVALALLPALLRLASERLAIVGPTAGRRVA